MTYANTTSIPSDRTRNEIERLLSRRGADRFAFSNEPGMAAIAFELKGRRYVFRLPLPRDTDFHKGPTGRIRTGQQRMSAFEQEVRSLWRTLFLIIKAKFEAVDTGIVTIEDEFLAQTVMSNGDTVSDYVQPRITAHYAGSKTPLLPAPGR